jgi:tetratricopeptide (TPR) repeat protein
MEANRLYRQALGLWMQRDSAGYAEAAALLEQVRERDPRFVRAIGLLAVVKSNQAFRKQIATDEGHEQARELASQALQLDSTDAVANYAGAAVAWANFDWDQAAHYFERAVEAQPQFPELVPGYASLLVDLGRRDDIERLRQFDVDTARWAWEELLLGDFLKARQYAQPWLVEGRAQSTTACGVFFFASVALGDTAAAADANRTCSQWSPRAALLREAYLNALAGRRTEELDLLTDAQRADEETMAQIHVALGEHERALELLQQAMDKDFVWRLSSHPVYWPLHSYRQFEVMLGRMGLDCKYIGSRHECEPIER